LKVIHFVTGGFSGATQVVVELVRACKVDPGWNALLVLRRKSQTPMTRVQQLRDEGLSVELVPGWTHLATIFALKQVCERFKPDVLVVHGFSEHLWGRYAGLLAAVPALVHVEHNSRERYSTWRLAQARWLAKRTALIVGCSEGVKSNLLALGFPPDRTVAIPNGIRLQPFTSASQRPFEARIPGIVMSARFARQKDHETLIRAVALLKERGLTPPVSLAGGGKQCDRDAAERLAKSLGLEGQVKFLGHCPTVPDLLMSHQLYVLSTHYEGMPLALVEAMAAGCAVVGSAVVGVKELLRDGVDGMLVPEADPKALADMLQDLLQHPGKAALLGQQARERAHAELGVEAMARSYDKHLRSALEQAQRDLVNR
jgi:glycosyltransferase involved in cell wall biosynthesis